MIESGRVGYNTYHRAVSESNVEIEHRAKPKKRRWVGAKCEVPARQGVGRRIQTTKTQAKEPQRLKLKIVAQAKPCLRILL